MASPASVIKWALVLFMLWIVWDSVISTSRSSQTLKDVEHRKHAKDFLSVPFNTTTQIPTDRLTAIILAINSATTMATVILKQIDTADAACERILGLYTAHLAAYDAIHSHVAGDANLEICDELTAQNTLVRVAVASAMFDGLAALELIRRLEPTLAREVEDASRRMESVRTLLEYADEARIRAVAW